uniref:Uncharacterized protein n=1 Tax=Timema douglasi TaxID=61478 RepID=A0A7R8ZCS2_TIMDO|nr:unnamed protein product [Timema douglasi]
MLEEFAMEKKPINRSVQPPGKGSTTDLKKSQDAGSKSFFRSSRRHEPNSSVASKWELGRKTASQKSKCFDKRPKPKGQYGGKEDPKVNYHFDKLHVEAVEYGSVIAPGSKKQNLNHLLNFHYAPREGSGSMWRSGGRQGLNRWMATHKHKYNKEQFLQANCQFVVKADGDYSVYSTNPDILVDWGLIEQIREPNNTYFMLKNIVVSIQVSKLTPTEKEGTPNTLEPLSEPDSIVYFLSDLEITFPTRTRVKSFNEARTSFDTLSKLATPEMLSQPDFDYLTRLANPQRVNIRNGGEIPPDSRLIWWNESRCPNPQCWGLSRSMAQAQQTSSLPSPETT